MTDWDAAGAYNWGFGEYGNDLDTVTHSMVSNLCLFEANDSMFIWTYFYVANIIAGNLEAVR